MYFETVLGLNMDKVVCDFPFGIISFFIIFKGKLFNLNSMFLNQRPLNYYHEFYHGKKNHAFKRYTTPIFKSFLWDFYTEFWCFYNYPHIYKNIV